MRKNRGQPYAPDAEDYWLFSREFASTFLPKIPPFFIGGVRPKCFIVAELNNLFCKKIYCGPLRVKKDYKFFESILSNNKFIPVITIKDD